MDISLAWLNRYLAPADCSAAEAERLLTDAGFPLESVTPRPGGDALLDVEVTSNRGDCLSHLGCAREIVASGSASTPRRLVVPDAAEPAKGPPIGTELTLENRVPEGCPLFTARLIRGVRVGPSPDWLRRALESVGQRSINNVVDITNFITLELGNPCHVFDHAKLAGGALVVRYATPGERVKTLYAGEHELKATDLVVADAHRPQSLAGVIGGFDSQVDATTTTVVFEMATWDPATIRRTGRRTQIRTDAAYRFERFIDPRTIDFAARRAVALLCEVSGGRLAEGVLSAGAPLPEPTVIDLRVSRVALLLGVPVPEARIVDLLTRLSVGVERQGTGLLRCTVPPHRHDLEREIDLIEEVARAQGLAAIPLHRTVEVEVRRPQVTERATREIAGVLTAHGFLETVTFSFTEPALAALFQPAGVELVAVDDDRRATDGTLRPSVLPGLLGVRKTNQDAQADVPGGMRLFETAATFGQTKAGASTELRSLALLLDVPGSGKKRSHADLQQGVRLMRGCVDALVRACVGPAAEVVSEPAAPDCPGYDPAAFAHLRVRTPDGTTTDLGRFGLASAQVLRRFDLDVPVVLAELDAPALISAYPPAGRVSALPQFPGTDRDLSLLVAEQTRWGDIDALVRRLALERLESHELVTIFRGEQAGTGRKSVTVRLRFRDESRTLRREEVEPAVERLAAAARAELGAEIRA